MSEPRTIDVALVGAGPKGFGCLERLAIELELCADPPQLRVTLHDPAAHPGAGPVYGPDQPDYLLMNFAARHVDIWSRDVPDRRAGARQDLVSWLGAHHPAWADADAFVPRRLVGAYLQAAFLELLATLPPQLTVRQVEGVVTTVERSGSRWRVHHEDPALDHDVDEVMVTTGHGTWPAGQVTGEFPRGSTTKIAPPYPVDTQLGVDRVPPGATVAVRGFALSFVDATLALTVGRGGRFEGSGTGGPAAAHYLASGTEPAAIVPFSRTGLPLLAKPGPALVARAAAMPQVWERLRERIRATTGRSLLPGLCDALAEAAHTALLGATTRPFGAELSVIEALLGPGCAPVRVTGARSLAAMRRSVQVASGQQPPDAAWAIGEAWRQGYPALVGRVRHGQLGDTERPEFDDLAVRLERLAFGAPAENLHKVVVLAAAGRVDLRHLRSPRLLTSGAGLTLATGQRRTPVDVLVDAVIRAPGISPLTPVWGRLLRAGHARLAPGTRGVAVAADATCLDPAGRPVPGLAAVGRATEGCVLGNDTLSRTLHDETRRWAERIVVGGGDAGRLTAAPAPAYASARTMASTPAAPSGGRP